MYQENLINDKNEGQKMTKQELTRNIEALVQELAKPWLFQMERARFTAELNRLRAELAALEEKAGE